MYGHLLIILGGFIMRKIKIMDDSMLTLDDAFEAFMEWKQSLNLSERTIDYYQRYFGYFRKVLQH